MIDYDHRTQFQASSNECDVLLDPFCGCGTTIAASGWDSTFLWALPLDERRVLCHAERLSVDFAATPPLTFSKKERRHSRKYLVGFTVSRRLTAHRAA